MVTTEINNGTVAGQIHGVNMSFFVAGWISVVGLILAILIKDPRKRNREVKAS